MKKLISLILLSTVCAAHAADFHVAPQGSDQNPGTKGKPFATLEAARDAIRALRASEADRTVRHTVLLHGGTYPRTKTFELDQRDSFTTYKPTQADGSAVRLHGGVEVPLSAVKPVTDPAVLNRVIEESARPHLRQIDLKALGVTEYGELGPRGFRRAYIPAPLELFIDGRPMQIARWPNVEEPDIPLGKVIEKGSHPRVKDYSMKPGTFEYGVDRPDQWTQARDFYISGIFAWGYADDTIKIAKLDAEKGTFTTNLPHLYQFVQKSFTKWYALNLLEEIDVPGEYYVDKASGVLYFYPPESASPQSTLHVSTLDKVMVAIENAEDIRIEGLTLEVSRDSGIYIEGGKNHRIAGCTLRNLGVLAIQLGQGIEPFPEGKHDGCGFKSDDQPGVPASRIMGSWHEHIYRFTAWDRKAGTGHRIVSCDIYDTGSGGIMLGGGDRKTLTPGNNVVENCDIYRVNRWDRTYKAQINVDGCGNQILNNHLHNAPGLAIYLHGNDHVIEYNEIDHVLTDMSDMGAIYMGRDPSETGNRIHHNFFHNIRNTHKGGYGVQAIFFDDHAIGGASVVGNVFYQAGSNGSIKFNLGGTWEGDIADNVFVDGPAPLSIVGGSNNTARVQRFMKSALGQERLLKHVDITKPPYSEKYPRLLATYKGELQVVTKPLRPLVTKASDPRFVDGVNLNFAFKDIAEVQEQLPGFEPIPFEKIGLKTNEYRTVK